MTVDRNTAEKLWKDVFGNNEWANDCFGTYIHRDDYGDYNKQRFSPTGSGKKYNYGWDIDHIRPKSNFPSLNDADFWNNFEPMHHSNNLEKADNYPQFTVGTNSYKVVLCSVCQSHNVKGYGIVNTTTLKRVDWKGVQHRCYT